MKEAFKGDRRFIAGALGAVFCALLLFHRYTELGRSLSNDYHAMVGTTLVAAVLGFGAVSHQTRSSYRQLPTILRYEVDRPGGGTRLGKHGLERGLRGKG